MKNTLLVDAYVTFEDKIRVKLNRSWDNGFVATLTEAEARQLIADLQAGLAEVGTNLSG